jgi:hypothetical protein
VDRLAALGVGRKLGCLAIVGPTPEGSVHESRYIELAVSFEK